MRQLGEKCCRCGDIRKIGGTDGLSVHAADLDVPDKRTDDPGIAVHVPAGRRGEAGNEDAVAVCIALQEILLCTADHFSDAAEGAVIMKFVYDGRAEFVRDAAFQKQGDAAADVVQAVFKAVTGTAAADSSSIALR